jgi:hypothetical protein
MAAVQASLVLSPLLPHARPLGEGRSVGGVWRKRRGMEGRGCGGHVVPRGDLAFRAYLLVAACQL